MSTSVGYLYTCVARTRPSQDRTRPSQRNLLEFRVFMALARKLPKLNCSIEKSGGILMRKKLGAVVGMLGTVFPRLIASIACAGIASGFALVPAANAVSVTNGDFATGNFAGWTLFTTANGSLGPSGSDLPAVTSFNVTGGAERGDVRHRSSPPL
jgi:hypothetical protein